MLYTSGFASARQLNRHFVEHGSDFAVRDAKEYEEFADKFLGGAKPMHVLECIRKHGDILRFDPATDAFGVLGGDGRIRTFYRPVRCALVPGALRASVQAAGRCHTKESNLLYFQHECAR